MRARIEDSAWRADTDRLSATFAGDDLDASLIQLLDLRFVKPGDERFQGTLRAVEDGLRRGSHMLRYATEDDFGLPHTAFNVCTFWLIEALWLTGRTDDARELFEEMLSRRTRAGLLSEDIDPATMDERALFHLLNLAREHEAFVLMTARQPPSAFEIDLRDLRSRLRALPVVTLAQPDDGRTHAHRAVTPACRSSSANARAASPKATGPENPPRACACARCGSSEANPV